MNTCIRYRLRSLFVGVGLAMLVAAEPAQAQTVTYNSAYSVALPLFMDTRANPSSLPGTGWYTIAVIQNTSASTAHVRVTAKPKQGVTGGGSVTFTLDPGSTIRFRPDNAGTSGTIGIPAIATGNFEGSLLIESDQPIVVVNQLANNLLGSMGVSGGTAKGFYNGIAASSGDLAFPGIKSGFNGKSMVLYVQNMGTTQAISTLTLQTNDGLTYTAPVSLAAGESRAFNGVDFKTSTNETWTKTCSGSANGSGGACFGAVKLANSGSFAAIAVQRDVAGTNPAPNVHVANFQTVVNATGPVSCAAFRNANVTTARSGIGIMNAGANTADITLKLIATGTNTQYTQLFPGVLPGKSVVASYWAGTIGGFPDGALGAATITSSLGGGVVAFVSESGSGTAESSYQCSTGSSNALLAPFVKFDYTDTNNPISATSEVSIQNTGTTSETITGTYTCYPVSRGTLETYTVTTNPVLAGTSIKISSASFPGGIPTGRICAAHFTSASSILGTVTERSSTPSLVDDATYELDQSMISLSVSPDKSNPIRLSCPSAIGLKSLCVRDCCLASAPTFKP